MARESLRSCPFCGGRAVFSRITGQGFSVVCQNCGAIAVLAGSKGREDLGAVWNRREVRPNFSQQNKAKPCPFCAGTNLVTPPGAGSVLHCKGCGMMVGFAESDDFDTTVYYWNHRVKE